MARKHKQQLCRICRKRPPWRYKNCPPGMCKRCYHKEIWPERLAAQARKRETDGSSTLPMVYDGYFGCFVPIEAASFDVTTTPKAIVELPWEIESPIRPSQAGRGKGGRDRIRA